MKQGRVIINRSICDNAPECSGIEVCPSGALYWDEEKERIEFNADACYDCGACAAECPVDAILWGVDDEDYERKLQEVENETRRIEELVVERYGASPINDPLVLSDIQDTIDNSQTPLMLLELFTDDSINCLLHSIRIEEILSWFDDDVEYHKVHCEGSEADLPFDISEYPALLLFKNKALVGCVCGHYDDEIESKEELKNLLRAINDKNSY